MRTLFVLPKKIFHLALLALAHSAHAQQPPTAGSQLQQIPPSPTRPADAAPELRIQRSQGAEAPPPSGTKILVNKVQITGARTFSEEQLIEVTGFKSGSELTLSDLRTMASKITAYYRGKGFFVAEAYLPAQDIKDNLVTIAVSEGQYGQVVLRNETNLSTPLAQGLLDGINAGDVIATGPLENRLLLLSDLPGVNVSSTLVPGTAVGTSDLLVDVAPGRRVTGSIDADNAGNRYTGQYRIGATVNLNNPLGRGDVASLRALTSGSGLKYGRASYQMQFGKATGGIAYSKLDYSLGEEFKSLGANGTAEVASVFGAYPLIRSRNNNLYARLGYDHRKFQDRIASQFSVTDKKARVLTSGLYGDYRDTLAGGGLNIYALSLSSGNLDIQTPDALAADAASAKSNGSFNKVSFSASRLQQLTGPFSLYAGVNGQLASKNLDVSEKMELGGMYAVRAYPEGESYADQGYVATLEARMQLPKFSAQMSGQMQLLGFIDTGRVTLHKSPWVAGENTRTLSGAGVGLTWADNNNFYVRAYYARKLGSAPATSAPDRSGRFWIQGVKYF